MINMKRFFLKASLTSILLCFMLSVFASETSLGPVEKDFTQGYIKVAHAVFEDAHASALLLQQKINQLIERPSQATLSQAKQAWIKARIPYQQSEVYRFGHAIVDDWEGQLNAWPLDEGLIDYVDESYEHELGNPGATANIIASTSIQLGSQTIDLTKITPEILASLNELAGSEANVATGYHAIEFLLWGQDLNGTGPGAGERPVSDFVQGKGCTHGHCDRRVAYLQAVTQLLITDLAEMSEQWALGQKDNHASRLLALTPHDVLKRALYGMGSLSLGELAGERMKVALEAQSPEDEHDCFSDNTHFSHFYNTQGVNNVYQGEYTRLDGSQVQAIGVRQLVAQKNETLEAQMQAALQKTQASFQRIVDTASAQQPMKFDQMIAQNNPKGQALILEGIQALVAQTQTINAIATLMGIENLNPDDAAHSF